MPHWHSSLTKKRTITSQLLWNSIKKHLSNNLQYHPTLYYFVSTNAIFLCVQVILYSKTHFLFPPSIGNYQYYFNKLPWSFSGNVLFFLEMLIWKTLMFQRFYKPRYLFLLPCICICPYLWKCLWIFHQQIKNVLNIYCITTVATGRSFLG